MSISARDTLEISSAKSMPQIYSFAYSCIDSSLPFRCRSLTEFIAPIRNPPEPAAGSITYSLGQYFTPRHIDNMARRKILAFFPFRYLRYQILKRFVNNREVGAEQACALQLADDD